MLPEKLRQILKSWISTQLRVDSWGLNHPESIKDIDAPPSAGLDQKISNYFIDSQKGFGQSSAFLLGASLPFVVTYRFDKSYQYTQIPRDKAETVLALILTSAKSDPCIAEDIVSIDPSGSVSVSEQSKADWILTFEINFDVIFNCESREFINLEKGVFSP